MRNMPIMCKPEDHDDDAADLRDQRAVIVQRAADGAGREAERDEDDREAETKASACASVCARSAAVASPLSSSRLSPVSKDR